MQFLRKLIEKQRKLYHAPDSKFHKVWPLFDAFETFLFSPDHRTDRSPGRSGVHVRDYVDLKRVMNTVIIAMLPCLLWSFWNTGVQHFGAITQMLGDGRLAADDYVLGWLQGFFAPDVTAPTAFDNIVFGLQRMLPIVIVSYGVGLGIEMYFAVLRNEEVSEGFLVSGMLIALIVPASIPLWQLATGVAFAVVLCKEVFGGTGMNIFNPAMMVRAFLFFAFAAQMSGDGVWIAGNNAAHLIDGWSSPTALAVAKPLSVLDGSAAIAETWSRTDLFFGNMPGSAGETSKLAVLLGAIYLVVTGVASWRVIVAGVIGLIGTAFVIKGVLPANYGGPMTMDPFDHLLVGGFAFGIVFMATDPVSSPETNTGKWIYGVLIGLFTVMVRTINPAYPEGTMLSVILLNAFAPTIDHFVVAANIKRRLARS